MTQVISAEHPTLFDVVPNGGFVLPDDQSQPRSCWTSNEWQEGLGRMLSQGERALAVVAPDSIDVAQYAGHVITALDAITQRNKDAGLAKAAESPTHRERIATDLGVAVDDIAAEVDRRAEAGRRTIRYEFYAASGLGRLAAATELTDSERIARREMESRFVAFNAEYGGTGKNARSARTVLKSNLANYVGQEVSK